MENRKKIDILLYHQVGIRPNTRTNLDCFCDIKEFSKQMKYLKTSGHNVISLQRAIELIFMRKSIDSSYVALSFDDGSEEFYDLVFPILEEFGFPSIVYPVTGFLGKVATFGKRYNPDLKIISKGMLKELSQLGVELGAHTMDHVKLTKVDRKEALRQIIRSKDVIEQLIGKRVSSFSYPHGDYNSEIIDLLKQSKFESALTCLPFSANKAINPFEIPRKYVTYFDDIESFKRKLN